MARDAGVSRAFRYRHPDLLEQVRTAEVTPARTTTSGSEVTRASLLTDLANARVRATRQDSRIRQLEKRLAELLGEQAWTESGFGAPDDVEDLRRQVGRLGGRVRDLTAELEERAEDLDAARATNRELMTRLNTSGNRR